MYIFKWTTFCTVGLYLRGRLDEAETTLLKSDLLFFDNVIFSNMQFP